MARRPAAETTPEARAALREMPLQAALALAQFLPHVLQVEARDRVIRHVVTSLYPGASRTAASKLLANDLASAATVADPQLRTFCERIVQMNGGRAPLFRTILRAAVRPVPL